MPAKKEPAQPRKDRHSFSKALPAFDAAMRKLVDVSKEELARRERAEHDAAKSKE
ncbi:MAG: hypothetical protein SH850_22520 [Planctomycetaceae bacterium]|nr:hypothetical protein [Planctomycetaceae bacterium]